MTTLKDTFSFYNELIKPLYSEIEAEGNDLPIELLFEIHAAFDHLKRFYLDEESEKESCEKAISHLKRGALDTFKLKLKYFNNDVKSLSNSNIDLEIIDSGNYFKEFLKDKNNIVSQSKEARQQESNKDKNKAFETWIDVSLLIDEFKVKYFDDSKVSWAKKKTKKLFRKETLASFSIGLITGLIILIIDKINLMSVFINHLNKAPK